MTNKQLFIFLGCMFGIAALFFFVPIEMFDGEVTYTVHGVEKTIDYKLSLSYFIGIGTESAGLNDVVNFQLKPMGYFLAFLMIIMLPFLIAIRVGMHDKSNSET